MPNLTAEEARRLFHYDPDFGVMMWLPRDPVNQYVRSWNTKYAGSPVGSISAEGYLETSVYDVSYQVHRLTWLVAHGVWPEMIDHINHNRLDNRLFNLRSVDNTTNLRNSSLFSTSTSGINGVTWDRFASKWKVQIRTNGKNIHLGRFGSLDDAARCRKAADVKYGFHPNHGENL